MELFLTTAAVLAVAFTSSAVDLIKDGTASRTRSPAGFEI